MSPTPNHIQLTSLSAWNNSSEKLKESIGNLEIVEYDPTDFWRIPFLNKLLGHKQEQSYLGIDTGEISDLINSLCINWHLKELSTPFSIPSY